MTPEEFSKVFESRYQKSRDTLVKKAAEYARQNDRLSNFKKAAGAMGCSPERACVGFMMKHIISIIDFTDDIEKGQIVPYAMIDEKVGDAINYLVLYDGLRTEYAMRTMEGL